MTTTTASGLQYDDTLMGSGEQATAGQRVSVHYTGWLYDPTADALASCCLLAAAQHGVVVLQAAGGGGGHVNVLPWLRWGA